MELVRRFNLPIIVSMRFDSIRKAEMVLFDRAWLVEDLCFRPVDVVLRCVAYSYFMPLIQSELGS
eukprot:8607179-Pyramimonas_sp.AAC.1